MNGEYWVVIIWDGAQYHEHSRFSDLKLAEREAERIDGEVVTWLWWEDALENTE